MTDKERLEEAKLMAKMLRVETRLPHDFPFDLVDWLVEQAEKREYWMKQHRKRANELEDAYFKIQLIENQNKRYREVINNINEKAMLYGVDEQVFEAIKEAIRVLEGEE